MLASCGDLLALLLQLLDALQDSSTCVSLTSGSLFRLLALSDIAVQAPLLPSGKLCYMPACCGDPLALLFQLLDALHHSVPCVSKTPLQHVQASCIA